jgi:hypothetical protein
MLILMGFACSVILLVQQFHRINALQEQIIEMQSIDWRGPIGHMGPRGWDGLDCNETRVIEEILKRIRSDKSDNLDPRTLVSNRPHDRDIAHK